MATLAYTYKGSPELKTGELLLAYEDRSHEKLNKKQASRFLNKIYRELNRKDINNDRKRKILTALFTVEE